MQMPTIGMPPSPTQRPDGLENTAQAITAAMLLANKGNCTCQVCQILRGVTDKMAEPFLQPKPPQV